MTVPIQEDKIASAAAVDGLVGLVRHARATHDTVGGTVLETAAAHGLGVTLPDNAIIVGGFIEVITTYASPTGPDNASIAVHTEGADDIVAAVVINVGTPWDAGMQDIVPDPSDGTSMIKLTAAREITLTIGVEAVTAGKCIVHIFYILGEA